MHIPAWSAPSVGVPMGHAWRRAATIIRCDSGKQRMVASFEHYRDTAKTWPASYGALMGEYWQVVAVEGARGGCFSWVPGVGNRDTLSFGLPLSPSPSPWI